MKRVKFLLLSLLFMFLFPCVVSADASNPTCGEIRARYNEYLGVVNEYNSLVCDTPADTETYNRCSRLVVEKYNITCLIISTITFIGIPLISIHITIPNFIKIVIGIVCLIIFIIYAPADTEKRPIISKKRRLIYKISTTLIGVLYIILSLYIKNNFMSNVLIFSLILQSIMILPITYILFGVSYNNYKNYKIDG